MPSGKVHDKLTVLTALAAVPVWWWESSDKDWVGLTVGLVAYLFSGFWLSDDLDTHSIAYKRWGAFRFLWWPYQKLVPHRSWVSHSIGFGPIFRVAYFLVMLWALIRVVLWLLIQAGVFVSTATPSSAAFGGSPPTGPRSPFLGHVRPHRPRSRRRHPLRRRCGGELGQAGLVNSMLFQFQLCLD